MTKTLIFDLGKVIVPFDIERGYRAMAGVSGLAPQEVAERIRAKGWFREFESGRIEPEDFHRDLMKLLGASLDYEAFQDVWSSIFLPETLIEDEFLAALKQRHRLVLLSNTNALHFPWVKARYPILRHFDEYVLSYEVKAMKPEAAIYRAALMAAQCEPEEAFYTDDIADFIAAAKEHRIDAVQFENQAQIIRELTARGVSI